MNNFLELKNLSFSYDNNPIIKNLSLCVSEGSFTTLLGSSGCGKTTLLRLIAGFLEPTSGEILLDGVAQEKIAPNERKIAMVFQDYALFPHLTVQKNLMYGLNLKKADKVQKQKNLCIMHEMAKTLGIENLLTRYPHQLSGGQQQRVALGRALVLKPRVLLMDEPLSSLDTNLRIKVREELKEIQQKLSITTLYVTHDQEEALALSDKIAVINKGELLQYDSPENLYFAPKDAFTANFIGKTNYINVNGAQILIRPEWIDIKNANHLQDDAGAQNYASANTLAGANTHAGTKDETGTQSSMQNAKNLVPKIIYGTVSQKDFFGENVRFAVKTLYGTICVTCNTLKCQNVKLADAVTLEILHFLKM